jgi:N-acylneuraminate cytidylyltransferase
MTSLGIVPARGGSKGSPNKNLRPLGGQPLLAARPRPRAAAGR